MYFRKVTFAVAVFAFGIALAAKPTSLRADWGARKLPEASYWAPGSTQPMSAFEPGFSVAAPH